MGYAYEDEDLLKEEEENWVESIDDNLMGESSNAKLVPDEIKEQKVVVEPIVETPIDEEQIILDRKKLDKKEKKEEIQNLPKVEFDEMVNVEVPMDDDNNRFVIENLLKSESRDDRREAKRLEMEAEAYSAKNLLDSNDSLELDMEHLITNKDERYFKAFIKRNYEKITQKKFNFAALIFGPIYFIYRKVYVVGLVWMMLNFLVSLLTPIASVSIFVPIIFYIGSYFACGYTANSIILNHVGSRILNYKMYDAKHVKEACIVNGGTSLLFALLALFISSSLSVIINYNMIYETYQTIILKMPKGSILKPSDQDYYDGTFKAKEDVNLSDIITIDVDPAYTKTNLSTNYSYVYIFGDGTSHYPLSQFEIHVLDNHNDPQKFIEAVCDYKLELRDSIVEIEYNGNNWFIIETAESSKNVIYASSKINDEVVFAKFMYHYSKKDDLAPYFDIIMDSIGGVI